MATAREATNLAEFVKFTTLGAAVFGRIKKYGSNNNGPFVTFEPAGYRPATGAPFTRYQEVACGLTTDLAAKVSEGDTGKMLIFLYVGSRPTSNKPQKLFNVYEIGASEAKSLIEGGDVPAEWMTAPSNAPRTDSIAGAPPELPF